MARTFDKDVVLAATSQVEDLKGVPPDVWLENPQNFAFSNPRGDVSLFEYRLPGVYTGHYFFFSRGRDAVEAAKAFLHEAFDEIPVVLIIGMTPLDKKGALWLSRRLGFQAVEDIDIEARRHRIFTMTRKDFRDE